MTDGLGAEFLSNFDAVIEQYNPYAQQFLHAREILIERSRPAPEAGRAECTRFQEEEHKEDEDRHEEDSNQHETENQEDVRNQEDSGSRREGGDNEKERNQEEIENQDADVHERLIDPEGDWTYTTPTASEVAIVIIDANAAQPHDIVLYTKQGGFNGIYETNPHYVPLYPLLDPYGASGWTYKFPYASEQNCNNDGEDEGRANYAQNDQNMEGQLAEWGYIVQYEDDSEG
ncbi:Helitron helicase [Phytophthora megakarya]|uniref:Helitron helicase n=1 Tax=Phytophthora megakarya TaxID=4795 RepID=A0A225V500_9STRA|nr:Helitron helicase [Phytophthora megakarya]